MLGNRLPRTQNIRGRNQATGREHSRDYTVPQAEDQETRSSLLRHGELLPRPRGKFFDADSTTDGTDEKGGRQLSRERMGVRSRRRDPEGAPQRRRCSGDPRSLTRGPALKKGKSRWTCGPNGSL